MLRNKTEEFPWEELLFLQFFYFRISTFIKLQLLISLWMFASINPYNGIIVDSGEGDFSNFQKTI